MSHDVPNRDLENELARDAYNAAFYELGLRWYWDGETWDALQQHSSNAAEQIHHYLTTHQSHLLTAYDADFLVSAIQSKQAACRQQSASCGGGFSRPFDWAQTIGGELGA